MINDEQAEKIVNEMFDAERLVAEVCRTTAPDDGTEVVVANACRALSRQMFEASKSISSQITSGILHTSPPCFDHNTLGNVARNLRSLGDRLDHQPSTEAILALATIIRKVDGSHSKGAAALAGAILSDPDAAKIFGGGDNG